VHKLTKQIRIIDAVTVLTVFVIGGYILWALLYPFKTVEIRNLNENGKVPVITKEVPAGGYLKYKVAQYRHTDHTATIVRNLVNGANFPLSAQLSNAPTGYNEYIIELQIPESTDPGVYHVRVTTEFEFPLDRSVKIVYQTEDFRVVRPDEPYEPPEEDPNFRAPTVRENSEDSSAPPGTLNSTDTRQSHTPETRPDPNEPIPTEPEPQPTSSQSQPSEPEPEGRPPEDDPLLCLPLVNICVL